MDEASLEIVNAGEMYPKQSFTSDDGVLSIPFPTLSGEGPLFRGPTPEGILIITCYRLYHSEGTFINIPLGIIEYVECKECFIYIYCKDCRSFRCSFENAEDTQKWFRRIQTSIKLPDKIDQCFAFRFLSWAREEGDSMVSQMNSNIGEFVSSKDSPLDDITSEAERMGFDMKLTWKISKVNQDYRLCPSYPRYLIVPACVTDKKLADLANYRYSKRIPTVVWRHQGNGCVLARSSQPRMGILSWRNTNDEDLLQAISAACVKDPGYKIKVTHDDETFLRSDIDGDISIFSGGQESEKQEQKKLLIIDARSYTAAVTNRAKGGGYECEGYYPHCELRYMSLANIHAIRTSFNQLRLLCAAPNEQTWLSSLESCRWLHYISGLIGAALTAVDGMDLEERPVLVHCSDGWDRTPQIVALAEIMLDPYYRTKKGFQVLVEREWLEFGHKFADRCGHPDGTDDKNERCPVFLQWLDCIYQLLQQFQCHFEFNEQYLARLALHTYSCLFGTFLCNTDENRRRKYSVPLRTFSVWPVLNEKSQFHNYLYNNSTEVLRPSCHIRDLKFWSDVYLPNSSVNLGRSTIPPVQEAEPTESIKRPTNLVKTKSCDNLHSAGHSQVLQRRNSDSNIVDMVTFVESFSIYPPIPIFHEGTLPSAPPLSSMDTSMKYVCKDKRLNIDSNNQGNSSERTDAKSSGITPKSNLILRELAIDGSTDTLVSECGAIMDQCGNETNPNEPCDYASQWCRTIATDTSDLPKIISPTVLQQLVGFYFGTKRNGASPSCSCSYTTPNHSRTPSSGFPATPCDDPSDMPNLRKDSSQCQIMEFDGLAILPNFIQERIKKLILHYKNKVSNLHMELSAARFECLQHKFLNQGKEGRLMDEDAPSVADSASSGDHRAESAGSESSWDLIWTPEHASNHAGL